MDKLGISLSLRYMFLLPPFILQGLTKLWLWWCQYKKMYLVRCCYCRFFNLNTRLNIYFFLYCLLINSSFNMVLWWYFTPLSNPFIPPSIFPSPLGWNGWGGDGNNNGNSITITSITTNNNTVSNNTNRNNESFLSNIVNDIAWDNLQLQLHTHHCEVY